MKSILLSLALAPLLLTGCAVEGGGYAGGGPAYYDGPVGVSYYSYDRGYYHRSYHGDYHGYNSSYRGTTVSRSTNYRSNRGGRSSHTTVVVHH